MEQPAVTDANTNYVYDVYLSYSVSGSDNNIEQLRQELEDKFNVSLRKENAAIEDNSRILISKSKVFVSCLTNDFHRYKSFMNEQSTAVAMKTCKGILWYILDDKEDAKWYIKKLREYGFFNAYIDEKNFFKKDSINELKTEITKLKDAKVEEEGYRSMEIPRLPIPTFVEKEQTFNKIRSHFQISKEKNSLILTGPPGVGKTTHAAQFAYSSKPHYIIRWLSADSLIKIDSFIKGLAKIFKIPLFGKEKSIDIIRLLRIQFSYLNKPTLLVLDNVEDYSHIQEFLDSMNTNVHYLITTRKRDLFNQIETIELEPFTADEADIYVEKFITGSTNADSDPKKIIRDYVKQQKDIGIMPHRIEYLMTQGTKNYSEYNILKLIEKHSRKQCKIISYLSFLHSDSIDIDILHELTGINKGIIEFDVSILESNGLIKYTQDTKKIFIHRLIQEMTIRYLKDKEPHDMIEIPKIIAAFLLQKHKECNEKKQSFEKYISHVEYLLKQTDQQNTFFIELSTIIAETQRSNFRYDGALNQYETSLQKQNRIYNKKPLDRTAKMLNTIGYLSYEIGKIDEALVKYKESMIMVRVVHNERPHLNIAETLSNLGALFQNVGNSDKALVFYHESLSMYIYLYNEKDGDSEIADLLNSLQETW